MIMIEDLKKMAAGTEVKGFPLLIKTARKAFTDAEGTTYQEVVFMDATGEMTGHILLEVTGPEPQGHHAGPSAFSLWKSKTNICIMHGVLQDTDERKKAGIKLVVYECFDAATPLTFDQGQDMQEEEWRKFGEKQIKGKIRHGIVCAAVMKGSIEIGCKKDVLFWQDFIMTGE